ncbi:MAG: M1 family metallopeptidase [Flavobacteriales bacterium]|nr:M1 family metallopeptidase [Flavobacteriia bacterium]NCP06575.1 M1 family metallopeptidase [Flavobacteriales bacterium]PIV92802.1 MAG: aminopeptidase [Flavobacteriaceae bacterium CG17_big_fil_post_rev_8_21_14_2_50_33_15]PIY13207.1 MAG: aminopeptidase [Flavobacteriaceae bacterium CG_4_10_14_3_um_filter_33_47]PJB18252.1 MAG: aminopeptidase [Flavobacteriaceae bacterium CG_4_9_14_3_um_filter_33_16]
MKQCLFLFFLNLSGFGFAQQTEFVDFKIVEVSLNIKPEKQEVEGSVQYTFKVLKSVDSIFIDAQNMTFKTVLMLGNQTISYSNDGKKLWLKHPFKKDSSYNISFNYKAQPKKALYFINWEHHAGNKQIWTQGQGKYTSNWLPSIDDMNDKIEFDLTITFDKDYEVIANGRITNQKTNDSTTTWHYNMQNPMSSYLVAFSIGKYHKKIAYSKSGIPLEMYYYPQDSLKIEPTYRHTKQMFDFLEEEIGVPYPWQNYKQVPVKDFLYAGMENTSTTIFSDAFVVDSIAFVDKNYVNVNAHELAHQWFGNLVTETSGMHHWLQEGFATYYALLAEQEVFGDDYYYWKLYEYAQELLEQDKQRGSTSLLDPKSSSTTFYKKGAWVLHKLREKVGDKVFKMAVKNYLLKHRFKNVETHDFIFEVEQASGQDLTDFVKSWLEDETFLYEECMYSLKKHSEDFRIMHKLDKALKDNSYPSNSLINDYFEKEVSSKVKTYLLSKIDLSKVQDSVLKKAFHLKDLKVRQAIAKNLTKIPLELKETYESLLNDKSYITIEVALYNLWFIFPESRVTYLNKTKNIIGFNNKNIRILWLTLALITPDFERENKQAYFNELRDYTYSNYGFETRQNAFQYLNFIQACDQVCKENLQQATKHHNWQFSKFAKELLKKE